MAATPTEAGLLAFLKGLDVKLVVVRLGHDPRNAYPLLVRHDSKKRDFRKEWEEANALNLANPDEDHSDDPIFARMREQGWTIWDPGDFVIVNTGPEQP